MRAKCGFQTPIDAQAADSLMRSNEISLPNTAFYGCSYRRSGAIMQVEIWSDVVCPWCYIGKRRFETAVRQFEGRLDVEVVWRSFELDPSAPKAIGKDMVTMLSEKYRMSREKAIESIANLTSLAASEGLEYHLESAKMGNSFDAHRLLQLAVLTGHGDAMKERLLKAYFTEAMEISSQEVLVELGTEVGLQATTILDMYAGDYMAKEVRSDEALASKYGIKGVPFYVFDSKYGVSGAQATEVFVEVLSKVSEESPALSFPVESDAPGCTDDSCAV